MRIIKRPAPEEYPAYSEMYMKHVPVDGMVLIHLKENLIEQLGTLSNGRLAGTVERLQEVVKNLGNAQTPVMQSA